MRTRKRLLFNANVAWFFISHRLAIAQAARDAGYEVHIAADVESEDEAAIIAREGIAFHRIALRRGGLNPIRDLGYLARLRTIVQRVKPDLIHNISIKPIIYGSVVGRAAGVGRIINAISGLGYSFSGGEARRFLSMIVRSAYRFALRDRRIRVIFQNADDVREFTEAGVVDPAQVRLIRGSGVDVESFRPSIEPPGVLKVVLAARMLRDKGIVEFARAAQVLRSRGFVARFVLAGMRDEANPASLDIQELRRLEQETGVEWLGHMKDIPALYRSAHVICLPSYREGLPKALIEACAAGRAIVTTDVPGCREVVTDGVNGLLVRPRDVGSLAEALGRVLQDSNLRVRLGAAGRCKAEAEFDLKLVVRATLELYHELLETKP
jgi:glycosyltransferase involved in cell wall biosynthesis